MFLNIELTLLHMQAGGSEPSALHKVASAALELSEQHKAFGSTSPLHHRISACSQNAYVHGYYTHELYELMSVVFTIINEKR